MSDSRTIIQPGKPVRRSLELADEENWLTCLLFGVFASALVAYALEWPHYRAHIEWNNLILNGSESLILGLIVWSKSQVLLLPSLACSLLLLGLGWRRTARWFGWVAVGIAFTALLIDLWTQLNFGTNATHYLAFAWDVLTAPGSTDHWQWAGNWEGILWSIFRFLSAALLTALPLVVASLFVGRLITRQARRLGLRFIIPTTFLVYTALVLFALPAQAFFPNRIALQRLLWALPVPIAGDLAESARRVFLGNLEVAPTVRIVSLVPQPRHANFLLPEVSLYNPSQRAVSLDGWRLADPERDNSMELSGKIDPGQTLTLPIPSNSLPLVATGAKLVLIDSSHTEVARVGYDFDDIDNGGLIFFSDETGLAGYLDHISSGVDKIYQDVFPRISSPVPIDDGLYLQGSRPRNVIVLILDSFRFNSLEPALMKSLVSRGKNGLRLNQHYAESNTSHLGTFALLFGRSPLSYEPTIQRGMPPQTSALFRNAGYRTHFVSIGEFGGWKQMDLFINDSNFDTLTLFRAPARRAWEAWPGGDTRALEQIQKLVDSEDQPQFIVAFLMSLHYPYPYPERFERFTPTAQLSNLGGWSMEGLEHLRNRYRNAVGFMDAAIDELLTSLDLEKNIVIVTGDHGESLFEDGAVAHGSRNSDIQMRVPFVMLGGGVKPMTVDSPTAHSDVLPTLLHALAGHPVEVSGAQGWDMLSSERKRETVLLRPLSRKEPGQLVLIHGQERLLLQYRSDRPEIEAIGYVDRSGYPTVPVNYQKTSPSTWIKVFRDEIRRLVDIAQ